MATFRARPVRLFDRVKLTYDLWFYFLLVDGVILDERNKFFSDLHWVLRGGGNNFGVVLGFTFKALPPKGKM